MARRITAGIDVGTHTIKIVVLEEIVEKKMRTVRVIGTGIAESRGMHHGYVIDPLESKECVLRAKKMAEESARVSLNSAFLAIGGVSLEEARGTAEVPVARADQEITELDVEKVLEGARRSAASAFSNRQILHEIPLGFSIDGIRTLGDPLSMKGMRLSGEYLFITALKTHIDALAKVVEEADIAVIDVMSAPLAASYVTLSKDQKMRGCALINMGAETTSLTVYDEGLPISIKIFPYGSAQITDDLALAFRASLEEAEKIKSGRLGGTMYPKKKVDEVINARLRGIFDVVGKHIKSLGKYGMLPAGVLIVGGGSSQTILIESAKNFLQLPARQAEVRIPNETKPREGVWAVACGVALWGLTGDTQTPEKNVLAEAGSSILRFLKQFLP